MFWSRLWFLLVAVAAVGAAAMLVAEPRMAQREVDDQVQARLEAADNAADHLLRLHARKWLDAVTQVSSDAILVEALDQATRGQSDLSLLHPTIEERLRYFAREWKAPLVIAVDGRGRVLGRAGDPAVADETQWKDDLSQVPVVAEALRGYRLDDTWDLGGKLYRICATPVVATPGSGGGSSGGSGERYAGALLVGQDLGADLAVRMRDTLGVDVAFLVRGQLTGQSSSLPIVADLPHVAEEHAGGIGADRRSEVIPVASGERRYGVVLAPLSGSAGAHGALYALMSERQRINSLDGVVRGLRAVEPTPRELALLGGALVAVLLIGFLLMGAEHGRRIRRISEDFVALQRGTIDRVEERRHAGSFRPLARAANALAERGLRRRVSAEMAAASPRSSTVQAVPVQDFAPAGTAKHSTETTPLPQHLPAPTSELPLPTYERLPALTDGAEALRAEAMDSPALTDGGLNSDVLPGNVLPGNVLPLARSSSLPRASAAPQLADLDERDLSLKISVAAAGGEPMPAPARDLPSSGPDVWATPERTTVKSTDIPDEDGEPSESDYQAVYKEFVAAKRTCGESLDTLSFDRFVHKLKQNRAQLMARYGCKAVKFGVYVKDGKAAVRATPLT